MLLGEVCVGLTQQNHIERGKLRQLVAFSRLGVPTQCSEPAQADLSRFCKMDRRADESSRAGHSGETRRGEITRNGKVR